FLSGWGGQMSLGQFALAGIGGAVAGGLATDHGVGFFPAVALAGVAGAVIAVGIGLPAVRLPGLFLAVTTLAFASNTQYFFLQRRYFGWLLPPANVSIIRPELFGGRVSLHHDLSFYYLCLVVLLLAVASARSIRSHRSGRVIIASRDNARAAQSYGINLTRTRLAAFALSGFFAAVAGALFAYLESAIDPVYFTPDLSVEIFAMTVIGGLTSVGGALAGAAYVVGFNYFLPSYALLASGVGMLGVLLFFPGGLADIASTLRDAFLRAVALRRGIHVPSLVADSRQEMLDAYAEDESVVAEAVATTEQLASTPTQEPLTAVGA